MQIEHEDVKDLIAAYVLGAIPEDEMSMVRAHILSCDICMAEADEHARVVSSLALSVSPAPMPAGFTDRVLEAAVGGTSEHAAAEQTSLRLKPRRRWGLVPVFGGIAILAVFALLTTTVLQTRSDLKRDQRVLTALLHNDESAFELDGQSGAAAAYVPTASGSYFVVAGLPEAPANHTYQLWLLDDGKPDSVMVFDVSDGLEIIETDRSLEGFEGAAVTIEPEGGSAEPTSDPILASA